MSRAKIYCSGETYDNKEFIKGIVLQSGQKAFRWDPQSKEWSGIVEDAEIDEIVEEFQNHCPAVTVQVDTGWIDPNKRTNIPDEEVPF